MALNQTLRYYRGNFDPEAAYQQQGSESGIISMYNPEVENQFLEAIAKRQERFDTTNLAIQQERVRIGEMETHDLPELEKRLKSFENSINETVKNDYNGDYGAAANKIAKMIGTERTNPFYHFNKGKVEACKSYLDAKMKIGANFIETESPFDVSFEDWQKGKTFEFTPINRNDIVQNAAATFSTMAKTLIDDPTVESTAGGKLLKIIQQKGIKDPQAVRDFLETDEGRIMYNQVLDSMPELTRVKDANQVHDAIVQGAYAAIGGTDVNFTGDPGYMDPTQRSKLLGTVNNDIVEVGSVKSTLDKDDYLDKPFLKNDLDAKSIEIAHRPYEHLSDSDKRKVRTELKKETSTPNFELNRYKGFETDEINRIKSISGNLNSIINNMQRGDLIGTDGGETQKLKGLGNLELKSWSVITTRNPQVPIMLNLHITGTPSSKKGTGTPAPKEVNVYIKPESFDTYNMFGYLSQLDNRFYSGVINRLKDLKNMQGITTIQNNLSQILR